MPLASEFEGLLVGKDDPYALENMPFGVVIDLTELGNNRVTVGVNTYGLDEEDAILVLLEAIDILQEAIDGD